MKINQHEIWLANLNPSKDSEPGKTRPVVIVQTDLLNEIHPTTIICPVTSKINKESELLRVPLHQLDKQSEILVDQIRAIDNKRLIKRIDKLNKDQVIKLRRNIKIVLEL